jgi:uncharacterized protein YraI
MRSKSLLLAALILAGAVAGCTSIGPLPTPVAPTKTPKPTFTATPDWTPTPVAFATEAPVAAEPTAEAAAPVQPEATAGPEATEAPTDETPTAEPPAAGANQVARLTANQTVNVRGGPGTNYPVIGRLSAGQAYPVTGKNARGDWYQFDLDGKSAWVIANLINVSGDPTAIQVAQNIPAAPTPGPTARPQPRPTSPPPAPPQPQPTAVPARRYEYNVAIVYKCERQPAGNWFDGTVYRGGQPFNGALVVFSYAPDGPQVTNPQISGPHEGYPGWNTGYFSHIIHASGPEAGNWFVWIVDSNGTRISEMANWQSTGPGEGCNQATVNFDSR